MVLALGVAAACQPLPDARELARRALDANQGKNLRAHGRLVHTHGEGRRRVYQVAVLRKRLPKSTNLLWSVTDPPGARIRILAVTAPDGATVVWFAAPGRDGAEVLAPKRWSERVLGSHLAIGDVVEDHLSWPHQTAVGEEAVSGKPCYVLRSEPGPRQPSSYRTILTWIDKQTLVPWRVLKHTAGSGPSKEILALGVRRSGEHSVASSVEFRTPGEAGSTRLVFTGGSEKARIEDRDVDPRFVFGAGAARE
jgi:hypothetical protein